jgi:hypothetical protein
MLRSTLLWAACAPALVACTGSVPDKLPDVTARALGVRAVSPCRDRACVYVMSHRGLADEGFVTMFPVGATGNVAPVATIYGPNTGLDTATAIALDSAHNIYVTKAEERASLSTQPAQPVTPRQSGRSLAERPGSTSRLASASTRAAPCMLRITAPRLTCVGASQSMRPARPAT